MFFRLGFLCFVVSLLACANARILTRQENDALLRATLVNPALAFEQWAQRNGVTYSTGSKEYEGRFRIWFSNLLRIIEGNKQSGSYWLGVNQFADLTFEEFAEGFLRDEPLVESRRLGEPSTSEPIPDLYSLPSRVEREATLPLGRIATREPLGLPSLLSSLSKTPAYVTIDFPRNLQFYAGGIFDAPANREFVRHRILAVGYDREARTPFVTLRTRFGRLFGEHGFVRICIDPHDRSEGRFGLAREIIIPEFSSEADATRRTALPLQTLRTRITRDLIAPAIPLSTRRPNEVFIPAAAPSSTQTRDVVAPTTLLSTGRPNEVFTPAAAPGSTQTRDVIAPTTLLSTGRTGDIFVPAPAPMPAPAPAPMPAPAPPPSNSQFRNQITSNIPLSAGRHNRVFIPRQPLGRGVIRDGWFARIPVNGLSRVFVFTRQPEATPQ